eukprot:1139300-Pelagomonas_calceolata.AAC.2
MPPAWAPVATPSKLQRGCPRSTLTVISTQQMTKTALLMPWPSPLQGAQAMRPRTHASPRTKLPALVLRHATGSTPFLLRPEWNCKQQQQQQQQQQQCIKT